MRYFGGRGILKKKKEFSSPVENWSHYWVEPFNGVCRLGKRSYSTYEPSCPRYLNSYKYDKYLLGCVEEGSHLWET